MLDMRSTYNEYVTNSNYSIIYITHVYDVICSFCSVFVSFFIFFVKKFTDFSRLTFSPAPSSLYCSAGLLILFIHDWNTQLIHIRFVSFLMRRSFDYTMKSFKYRYIHQEKNILWKEEKRNENRRRISSSWK